MVGFNRIIMAGNLTKDPEMKNIGSQSVCKLTIACNRQYKNKQGAIAQEVCFIDVDVWGPQADNCKMYLQKGRSVLVEGRLRLDSWKDQEGVSKSKHSITAERVVFLGSHDSQGNDVEVAADENFSGSGETMTLASKDQASAYKAKEQPKVKKPSTGNFKDTPAFEEDLPF